MAPLPNTSPDSLEQDLLAAVSDAEVASTNGYDAFLKAAERAEIKVQEALKKVDTRFLGKVTACADRLMQLKKRASDDFDMTAQNKKTILPDVLQRHIVDDSHKTFPTQ